MIPIDKGMHMPHNGAGNRPKYPFRSMEIGDSFFVAGDPPGKKSANVMSMARRHLPMRFASRQVTEGGQRGIRVWRIA